MSAAALTIDELGDLLSKEFPQAYYPGCGLTIERVDHGRARVRRAFGADLLRPGGTISGPTMMALADFAMYVAVLAAIGAEPLAVTTNLSINFLRKPAQVDLLAEARLFKIGKRLAVGEVGLYSDGLEEPVAHVTATYSIPNKSHLG
jgi:uncharacterized protein (TIGR00369 family)